MMFDKEGRFRNCIGKIGSGPGEYPLLSDFDVKNENIYYSDCKQDSGV
ncbi:6-bladed beta-propeller [Phocaeicola coprophilus]